VLAPPTGIISVEPSSKDAPVSDFAQKGALGWRRAGHRVQYCRAAQAHLQGRTFRVRPQVLAEVYGKLQVAVAGSLQRSGSCEVSTEWVMPFATTARRGPASRSG
jgi:hypothetical protein